ncbi:PREDICTED: uncharacterized protein C8orf48 homolog isoform X1 [Ficedula albicollis]|uniref:uncharacterized protein C8orf48 homolog isoform X1 n=1 Tax=Ficedula albicollis TaxID=59894 RepID=UPI0007AD799A|nr:PREDICTED: uncharacterized protein C8orf48 homolog isoform X1 [Ficedula albicollis]XP_016153852.1 PREDICTED: uncharacterized protein C8orf48 homolog isoform X1 [Ficedula albicollis]
MAAAPAESSKKGLGLSQSHSNSALDYSGDTFEPLSEDEEEEESQAPGSWCSTEDLEGAAVSEVLESSSPVAGPSPAGMQSSPAPEEESEAVGAAIGKWIDAMGKGIDVKNQDPGIKPDKSLITAPAGVAGLSPAELAALRTFCSSSISRMQQEQPQKCRKLHWRIPARPNQPGDSCAVPAQLMNRILLGNTRQAVKQVTEAEIHEASTCPECQQKEAELARAAFLRHKKTLLQGALIQERLEEQLYSRDMLTLLGEALRSFPKPAEDLWQRLKDQEMKNLHQP